MEVSRVIRKLRKICLGKKFGGTSISASSPEQENYIRNGATLLEKQMTLFQGKSFYSEPLRIFSYKDIRQATNNFDQDLIIGTEIATVYKGIMENGRVAIKVREGLGPTEGMINFFLNQVTIKQVINHKNVVRLYGCCLETEIPVLVFEFLSNGTLYDNLHRRNPNSCSISWSDRVRIAGEISYALSYMHLGSLKPIVHLDVKTMNIFLDEHFTAKLSNFGFSTPISPEETVHSWAALGTDGYMDPEYQDTLRVNEKCDVYSFGVVLIELLTAIDPFAISCGLANYFVPFVEENRLNQVIDSRVLEEGSREEIQAFAALAFKCVGKKGDERPTMKEVALELRRIHLLVRS
ncbi:wall-associated receptor kinase-like 1 [Durio zibethinus]|uniref:Wall-associated receptor kinase-like 1 n=1 Tax=Durio zibethinus TaxID=66656 RepID=A0A6P5YWF2_DURZI|nr:wall-associated receptor kinase-like 1 [Durio zibethinus]